LKKRVFSWTICVFLLTGWVFPALCPRAQADVVSFPWNPDFSAAMGDVWARTEGTAALQFPDIFADFNNFDNTIQNNKQVSDFCYDTYMADLMSMIMVMMAMELWELETGDDQAYLAGVAAREMMRKRLAELGEISDASILGDGRPLTDEEYREFAFLVWWSIENPPGGELWHNVSHMACPWVTGSFGLGF